MSSWYLKIVGEIDRGVDRFYTLPASDTRETIRDLESLEYRVDILEVGLDYAIIQVRQPEGKSNEDS